MSDYEERRRQEFAQLGQGAQRELTLAHALGAPVRVTWMLLALLILLWAGAWLMGMLWLSGSLGLSATHVSSVRLGSMMGLKLPAHIHAGQWWRLITSTFTHLDIMHMAFNGYGLYSIGPLIERLYGRWRFVVLYLGAGVLASLSSLIFSPRPAGGASGALYGLVGATLVVGWRSRQLLPAAMSRALTVGMLPWVVFGIGIGFLGSIPMDNAAHIGGLLGGALLALGMRSTLAPAAPRWSEVAVRALALALVGATAWSMASWSAEVRRCSPSAQAFVACYPELRPLVLPADESAGEPAGSPKRSSAPMGR